MARRRAAGVSLYRVSSVQGTTTLTPPASRVMSLYDTQCGAGTMTSSPSSSVAASAMYTALLAPGVARTSFIANSRPLSRRNFSMIAFFN